MTAAVLMPSGITDEWRARARTWVVRWYGEHFPGMPIYTGEATSGQWSKGEAIADACAQVLHRPAAYVLADADSIIEHPAELRRAIELVSSGEASWVVPHNQVYRLRDVETQRLHDDPTAKPRLGWTCRPIYEGPAGGGITVVSPDAFDQVRGIDRRFLGWGGEDLAFGYALETLVAPVTRLEGRLVHLWHPHPAPNLRGSPESEELVAQYKQARGVRRRMEAVTAGETWSPLPPLADPVRFRMTANRQTLRLPTGDFVHFQHGIYETTDPDEVEQIRAHRQLCREEPRR